MESHLYIVVAGRQLTKVASGNPNALVRVARENLARLAGDDVATDMFGVRGFTARGNVSASADERFYASGLRNGRGFACGTADVMVCCAADIDQALQLIADATAMLESAAQLLA